MGECIITRSGSSSEAVSGPGFSVFYANDVFTAPKTGTYKLEAVGGGGGGNGGNYHIGYETNHIINGGYAGSYNTKYVNLNKGDKVNITIGAGGIRGNGPGSGFPSNFKGTAGGTTFIGSYLSANGGAADFYNSSFNYYDTGLRVYIEIPGQHGYSPPDSYDNGPYGAGGSGLWCSDATISVSGSWTFKYGSNGGNGMAYISWT